MHEISLVQELLKQLSELAKINKCEKITKVIITIGPLAGIVIDSFQFGFDSLAPEIHYTKHTELEIIVTKSGNDIILQRVIME